MPVRAGHLLGEDLYALRVVSVEIHKVEAHEAVRQLQRCLHGVSETLLLARLDHQAVHHNVDVVLDLLFQLRRVGELVGLPVHVHTRITLGGEVCKQVLELTLTLAHDRRKHLEFRALFVLQDPVNDLLWGLSLNHSVTFRTVGGTRTRVQQTQVVVDLSNRAYRRARVAVG